MICVSLRSRPTVSRRITVCSTKSVSSRVACALTRLLWMIARHDSASRAWTTLTNKHMHTRTRAHTHTHTHTQQRLTNPNESVALLAEHHMRVSVLSAISYATDRTCAGYPSLSPLSVSSSLPRSSSSLLPQRMRLCNTWVQTLCAGVGICRCSVRACGGKHACAHVYARGCVRDKLPSSSASYFTRMRM